MLVGFFFNILHCYSHRYFHVDDLVTGMVQGGVMMVPGTSGSSTRVPGTGRNYYVYPGTWNQEPGTRTTRHLQLYR